MFYHALATDYDGTIAEDGTVPDRTVAALSRLRDSGRKLILVTGRELPDLQRVFPRLDLFDKAVVENGALLYTPVTGEVRQLSQAPPFEFIERLGQRGVKRLSVGRAIVATWEPYETIVLETIRELGLELEIIFNKGAVMVLPTGINKASGLAAALADLQLSALNVLGAGDAENDHAFLRACGLSVAVANALPSLKKTADFVTRAPRGAGVEEVIDRLLKEEHGLGLGEHHRLLISAVGNSAGDAEITPRDVVLITGKSGIGKSTLVTALTEKLVQLGYQFCIFDPEGDYDELEDAIAVGDIDIPPSKIEILDLMENPRTNAVVNTLSLDLRERPEFFAALGPVLLSQRLRTGRPHWVIVDEAHHLLPAGHDRAALALPRNPSGIMLVTVHPDSISHEALAQVDVVLALGPGAGAEIDAFALSVGDEPPGTRAHAAHDQLLFWRRRSGRPPLLVNAWHPRQVHKRHTRKYAEGVLDEERSFYFRGPAYALNIRAHNLIIFLQIAEGVDDATWEHHLRSHDYSKWFCGRIQDDALANEAEAIENDHSLSPQESRRKIAEIVRRRYTGPVAHGPR